jgi:hypothetical protein
MTNLLRTVFTVLLFSFGNFCFGQTPPLGKTRILVMPLDTMQFYSNVFYLEDLAYFNMLRTDTVIKVYTGAVTKGLREFRHNAFEYVMPTDEEVAQLHRQVAYVELDDEKGETYFGVAPTSEENAQFVMALMDKYKAEYFLSVNFYELFSRTVPGYIYATTRHRQIIHYDLFDRLLNTVHSGRYVETVSNVMINRLGYYYHNFANEPTEWILAMREGLERGMSAQEIVEDRTNRVQRKKYGLTHVVGVGLGLGVGTPYGAIHGEVSYHLNENVDINAGIGYDFTGVNMGVGMRYYLSGFNTRMKPFIGVAYNYIGGSTFRIGAEKDEFGNYINPNAISEYRLLSNHLLHARGGLSFVSRNFAVQPTIGYSIPFNAERYEVVYHGSQVTDPRSRNRTASFLAGGGLEISFSFIWYFKKN